MHMAEIDYIANSGNSLFHRASPLSKMIFTGVYILVTITSFNLPLLAGLFGFSICLYIIAKVPLLTIGVMALFPAFFSILFALALSGGVWQTAVTIILRAITAALILIFLFSTTPYVDLFGYLSKWFPPMISDLFLFTYRGLFILLQKSNNLFRSLKLRGGWNPWAIVTNIKNISGILGLLFIHSMDVSERMFHVLSLRGYESMALFSNTYSWRKEDNIIIVLTLVILVLAVIVWR